MKKKWLIYSLSLAILSASFVACKQKNDRLSRQQMVELLTDMQLAEAIYQSRYEEFNTQDKKEALMNGVLQKHGITQAQLDSTLAWYADYPADYLKINDSVVAKLTRESKDWDQKIAKSYGISKKNNSVISTYSYLTNADPTITFDIDSIKSQDYTKFELSFNSLGLNKNIQAEYAVVFEYTDTTIVEEQFLSDDVLHKITNPTFTGTLKGISGYIHIDKPRSVRSNIFLYNILLKGTTDFETEIKTDSIK